MDVLSEAVSLQLLDGTACALLAAAAAVRARSFGANFLGVILLGCICGLFGPLLREMILHGQGGTRLVASELPDEALVGAAGGIIAWMIVKPWRKNLFNWLDNPSIALASCAGCVLAWPETGLAGGIVVGLINGLAPGLLRDVALGDTAMFLEKEWYAAAALIGCLLSLAVLLLSGSVESPGRMANMRMAEWAVAAGAFLAMCIRAWKDSRTPA